MIFQSLPHPGVDGSLHFEDIKNVSLFNELLFSLLDLHRVLSLLLKSRKHIKGRKTEIHTFLCFDFFVNSF